MNTFAIYGILSEKLFILVVLNRFIIKFNFYCGVKFHNLYITNVIYIFNKNLISIKIMKYDYKIIMLEFEIIKWNLLNSYVKDDMLLFNIEIILNYACLS